MITDRDMVHVKLRDGKTVKRKLRRNRQGYPCIKYLGHWIFIEYSCGMYYEYERV